jgi:hypothetical protein
MSKQQLNGCTCGKEKTLKLRKNRVYIGLGLSLLLVAMAIFDRETQLFYLVCLMVLVFSTGFLHIYYYMIQRRAGHTNKCAARYGFLLSQSFEWGDTGVKKHKR